MTPPTTDPAPDAAPIAGFALDYEALGKALNDSPYVQYRRELEWDGGLSNWDKRRRVKEAMGCVDELMRQLAAAGLGIYPRLDSFACPDCERETLASPTDSAIFCVHCGLQLILAKGEGCDAAWEEDDE